MFFLMAATISLFSISGSSISILTASCALLFYSLVNDITSQTLSDFGSILKESQLSVSKKNMLCIYATDCVTHVIFDVFAEELLVTIIARSHSLDIFELLTLAKVKMYVLNGCNINFCGLEPT